MAHSSLTHLTVHSDPLEHLIREMNELGVMTIESYYQEHSVSIKSVSQVNDAIPLRLVFFCVDKMAKEGRKISGETLHSECESLVALIPGHFRNDLRPVERDGKEITVSDLETRRASRFSSLNSIMSQSLDSVAATDGRRGEVTQNLVPSSRRSFQTSNQTFSTPSNFTPAPFDSLDNSSSRLNPADGNDYVDNINVQLSLSTLEPPSILGAGGFSNQTSRPLSYPDVEVKENMQRETESTAGDRLRDYLVAVERENELLEISRTCTLCKTNPRGVTFLPCGHFITCLECAGPIFVCSVCRKNILATVDTYLS
ncbi:unnamed protein product [Lymnaea stagnalis]|uniref:RING-type domain-containing protein n=1 Tax=Lymnaea stagnalis TaxID=6523 RepID=A0AAV2HTY8_LYMST